MPLAPLPFTLPAAHTFNPGVTPAPADVDMGSYDFLLGGYGFRFATDQQNAYQRLTEPTTAHRFDSSLEPGEQSLSPLPWVKAQSSFHGGAGQLNLEQGFTAFQYQQEQVEHVRFADSQGVNVWTPGQVTRLPDCTYSSFGFSSTLLVTGTDGTSDYGVVGGTHSLYQLSWPSGVNSTMTATAIDLSGVAFGGASNCTVKSLCTDGANYYALITLAAPAGGFSTLIVKGSMASTSAPTVLYHDASVLVGAIGWSKARLIGGIGSKVYELDANASAAALPTAKYTHPSTGVTYTAVGESPDGVLVAALVGGQSTVLMLTLDTGGNTPTLGGGETVAKLPPGEIIRCLDLYLDTFLAIGTDLGIRVSTFDTYTGKVKTGPLSYTSSYPVRAIAGRDRFMYAGVQNGQPDGKSGLLCLDLSYVIDAAGRLAYANDLRPPTTGPATGAGAVTGVGVLPLSHRLVWVTAEGVFVEGASAGTDGAAWLKTSRIRFDTTEKKLFTFGRIEGALNVAEVDVVGILPFQSDVSLGAFGFVPNGDPGEFGLPDGLQEWLQLKFTLIGSACKLNGYQVKALPAPPRQHIITLTALCFKKETARDGQSVTELDPRTRYYNVRSLENGAQVRFIERTNNGPVSELVVVDQMVFQSFERPSGEGDFGGYITFKLRSVTDS